MIYVPSFSILFIHSSTAVGISVSSLFIDKNEGLAS